MESYGTLYIIATPLGNTMDMTYRSVDLLKNSIDRVYCEDTRISRRLLQTYDINLPTNSLHSHSSDLKIDRAIEELKQGQNLGYMTDCGTPGISDPGNKLVDRAHQENLRVIPLPGASALPTIVSVSGFPSKNILFAGFLSKKPGRRINEMTRLAAYEGTIVLYESPHRIIKTLNALCQVFTDHNVLIGREMTKQYEEYIRFHTANPVDILNNLTEKGEFCIAIDNN